MNCKIMTMGNLEDISRRLAGCSAILCSLCETAEVSCVSAEAVSGVEDLLDCIRRDFQADIDAAKDYAEKASP